MRRLYSSILYALTPIVIGRLLWRSRRAPAYRRRWGERFGFIPPLSGKPIWVHAVSVGETLAAAPLIHQLLERYPDVPLLVTTTTPTGSERVQSLFGDRVHHVYMPYDLPGAVSRFLQRVQPRLALVMETELWPNLFHRCKRMGVPVVVANARLSERSAAGYARFAGLSRETLNNITVIAAQDRADADRFIALGIDAGRVQVTGSIKFDISVPAVVMEEGAAIRNEVLGANRRVWIAASTHEGEDELVLDAFARVKETVPEALLLLVPRHPERFGRVAQLCRDRGYRVVCRSEGQPCQAETDIFLGDTMGEMMRLFAASDVVFMGGSLVATGGHNLLEPAALGLPVVFGPHMFNFAAISRLFLEQGAARQISDVEALVEVVSDWLRNPQQAREVGQAGLKVVEGNRGALERLLAIVAETLS